MVYKKEIFQFLRDTDDENDWLEEKMRIVSDEEFGTSLQEVNLLIKKIKTLKGEIDNHEPRIRAVCEDGQRLIDRGHPDSGLATNSIFFLFTFCEKSLICLEGKSMTP